MGAKLYPEVDHMALGQRYCDHVMAMTAEGLHDKSDIAGQLAWRDDQLAAKDREIAELRKQLSAEKCELRWAYGEAQETDVEKCAWKQRAQQAESERDEARECVGRLYKALNAFNDIADYDCKGNSLQCAARDEFEGMWAALAATPEGLR